MFDHDLFYYFHHACIYNLCPIILNIMLRPIQNMVKFNFDCSIRVYPEW